MTRRLAAALLALAVLLVLLPGSAQAQAPALPFVPDCKDAPVPDTPGQGLSSLFGSPPKELPPDEDPFAKGAKTTIYEQYGLSGLRFNNYDLGCGPDAARDPGAVIGSSIANWVMQLPLAMTELTGSITGVAYQPTFLGGFDPVITKVSTALHQSLFQSWLPIMLVFLGGLIILKSRRSQASSTLAAVGWALFVIILATALFRWPVTAGHVADETVTSTLGTAVSKLDGRESPTNPGTAVASHVQEAILYRAWLSGTLGSADSVTARTYGPDLFKAQALTWREAAAIKKDPSSADGIVEKKQEQWKDIADKIQDEDPDAYQYLTGKRSETRIGYSLMAALATLLALPFLLLSALLLLGCYLIVRLGVMMFPAFATLGVFPAASGLVIGIGRVVGAAIVNSIVFGVGAGVTILVLGLLFNPGNGTPAWLGLVLMPLFTFIMWKALTPFRRLTHMVSPRDGFQEMVSLDRERRGLRRIASTAAGVFAGSAAADVIDGKEDEHKPEPPTRAEARPTHDQPSLRPIAPELPAARIRVPGDTKPPDPGAPPSPGAPGPAPAALPEGHVPRPTMEAAPPAPVEAEWVDGEEVYPIYRPTGDDSSPEDVDADEVA